MAWNINNLRFVLQEETNADSPVAEELMHQFRENDESLTLSLWYTGDSGTLSSDPPNDTTGVATDSGASYDADEHNGRYILFTSGNAINKFFTIDDTTSTTLVCTGDNLYDEGARSGDTYIILYKIKATAGHDHDGVNSKEVTPASASLTQSMLKTSTGEVQVDNGGGGNQTLPGGEYGFYPQMKVSGATPSGEEAKIWANATSTSYTTNIYITNTTGSLSIYAQQRYVTSSGERHWIFVLRDHATGAVLRRWSAADHPCFGNSGKPLIVQHPFTDIREQENKYYKWDEDGSKWDRVSIIVLLPTRKQIGMIERARLRAAENERDFSFFEAFDRLFEVDEATSDVYPQEPVTVALPKVDAEGNIVDDWRFMPPRTRVEPIRKTIVKPDLLHCLKIKRKALQEGRP